MQYLILIHDDPSAWAAMTEAEQGAVMQEYFVMTGAFGDEGIMRGGAALVPSPAAKLVRVRDGGTIVSDGPYAETREQLGGYYLVETDTEEQAIAAAARIPSARFGTIEVRPVRDL